MSWLGRAHAYQAAPSHLLPALRVLVALVAALGIAACGAPAPGAGGTAGRLAPTSAKRSASAADTTAAAGADPRGIGDPNAPIRVVEYSDFQCPFCARFVGETAAQLQQAYIDTGKVYFSYRDFPLVDIHPGALLAAHVANCAGEQGSFWPMHDQLFAGTSARAWGAGDTADFSTFMAYAAALRLDVGKVQECVQANRYASQIEADFRDAAALGVRSTPTFVVNGQLLVGAQPYAVWQNVLDDLLAAPQ